MSEIPEFSSYEELEKYLDKKKKKPSNKSKAKGKKRVAPKKDTTSTKVSPDTVYQTIHFYVRQGDNWQAVLEDAKEENSLRGPGVIVNAHNHSFKDTCTHLCRSL